MNHTNEPWYALPNPEWENANYRISNKDNDEWGSFNQIAYAHKANAKRIVACVNACAGITNEALEAGYIKHLVEWDEVNHNYIDLEQRIELLEMQLEEAQAKAAAYDRLMSGGQKTPKEIANIFGFPIAMDCYSSNHEFQHGSDWHWFTAKPFIDGENDCWTFKRGMWGKVPYGLLDGYVGDWQDSLTLPDGWETKGESK